MGLPSLHNVAVSSDERQAAEKDFGTMGKVSEELIKLGFELNTTPPKFPMPEVSADQLTTTVNRDYTTMYAQQLGWLNYASPILAYVKGTLIQIENALKDIETKIRKEMREKNKNLPKAEKLSEKDIEDLVWLDPDHKRLTIEKQTYTQMKLRLDSHVEAMQENMRVISRQVEIRKLELGNEGVENHMAGRGRYQIPRRP